MGAGFWGANNLFSAFKQISSEMHAQIRELLNLTISSTSILEMGFVYTIRSGAKSQFKCRV